MVVLRVQEKTTTTPFNIAINLGVVICRPRRLDYASSVFLLRAAEK